MKYIVYGLTEPDTGQVRYIGRTQDLPRRISEHLNVSKGCSKVIDWVFALKEGGTLPSWKVLEETNNWAREKYWKELYESQGCKLLNQKVGGSHGSVSAASKKLLSESGKAAWKYRNREHIKTLVSRTRWHKK